MNIIIAVASKHGSTTEIAQTIAFELRQAGHIVAVCPAKHVHSIEAYDAAIIGSAVYMGRWLPEARQFVAEHQDSLSTKLVWLFSSGPVGAKDSEKDGEPVELDKLLQQTNAREHKVFDGNLNKDSLGFTEKLVIKAVGAPYGDFRPWPEIQMWASEIVEELASVPVTV